MPAARPRCHEVGNWRPGDHKVRNTSFLETQTILKAIEFAITKGGFGNNARMKKTAAALIKDMKGNASVSGRHQQLMDMLKRGATLQQMMKATGSSRRTIFRYLNHFEEADVSIVLEDGKYRTR